MKFIDEELNRLSESIFEWSKGRRPISEAPDEIAEIIRRYKERYAMLEADAISRLGPIQ